MFANYPGPKRDGTKSIELHNKAAPTIENISRKYLSGRRRRTVGPGGASLMSATDRLPVERWGRS
jgi:hypothetical protein